MTYKFTSEWLAGVSRSSREFLTYSEGRYLAKRAMTEGPNALRDYLADVKKARGEKASEELRRLSHEIYLAEKGTLSQPLPLP